MLHSQNFYQNQRGSSQVDLHRASPHVPWGMQRICGPFFRIYLTLWFAIVLAEIRTRRLLREKADCKQSRTKGVLIGPYIRRASLILSPQSPSLFLFLQIPYHFWSLLRRLKEKDNGNKTTRLKSALAIFFCLGKGKMRWISSCFVLRNSLIF